MSHQEMPIFTRTFDFLRAWEKITLHFIALRFRSDLVDLIEPNRKRSLSYVEDSANEDRANLA